MKQLLFLDIETTGLNPEHAALLELSAVRVSLDARHEAELFDELTDPCEEIPIFITKLTGITQEMVTGVKSLEQVREEFARYLQPEDVICGHNIRFDTGFLQAKGFDIPNPTLDTFPLSNVLLPNQQSYSLEILTKEFEIDHHDAHRALADVRANIDLYRVLLAKAAELPPELLEKYQQILQKSDWTGRLLFEAARPQAKAPAKKTEDAQGTLFDVTQIPDPAEPRLLPAQERMAAEKIVSALQSETDSLISLPQEADDFRTATEAARLDSRKHERSVAVAVPKLYEYQTPTGFFRFASQNKVLCSTLFEKWLEKAAKLGEDEITAAMKITRAIFEKGSLILADIPMVRGERDVAENWLSAEHVRCPSECPAKAIRLEAPRRSLFLCEYSDLSECPAKDVILLKSDDFDTALDQGERVNFALSYTERWLEAKAAEQPAFCEKAFFTLGLLKRFVRERVGDSPYRADLGLSAELLEHSELHNIAGTLKETASEGMRLFPEARQSLRQLKELAALITDPLGENEYRFVSIYPDENLFITRAPTLLQPILDRYLAEKERVVYLGSCFLKRGSTFSLGGDLKTPSQQLVIATEFDFQKNTLFVPVSFGGNSRNSDSRLTARLARELLPLLSGHLLVLFPGYGIAEKFSEEITDDAQKHGYKILFANNSTGKISAQLAEGKAILIATAGNWHKIDFSANTFSGCLQHRLLFDPPADPAAAGRYADVGNEFQEVALPKAIRYFQRLLSALGTSGKPFFWLCLDSHFTKRGGFADQFLQVLPPALPVRAAEPSRMPAMVADFSSTHEK